MGRNADVKTYEVVYDTARDSLARQEASLDELRSRTASLLAAQALVSSFLGSVALEDGGVHCYGAVAIISLVAGIALSLLVLAPWHWVFRIGVNELLDEYVEHETKAKDIAGLHREAALQIEGFVDSNQVQLTRLYLLSWGVILAVGLQVVGWLLELAMYPAAPAT
jgi:hypothetical protein